MTYTRFDETEFEIPDELPRLGSAAPWNKKYRLMLIQVESPKGDEPGPQLKLLYKIPATPKKYVPRKMGY